MFKDDNISFLAYTLHLQTITSIEAVKINRERNSQRENILSSSSYKICNTNDIYTHPKLPFNKAIYSKKWDPVYTQTT